MGSPRLCRLCCLALSRALRSGLRPHTRSGRSAADSIGRCAWPKAALALLAVAAGPRLASSAAGPEGGPPLSSLNRLLKRFDFEEAERAPFTMPLKFYRHIAPDQGFPAFGETRLTDEVAHGGRWSFELKTAGGSLSARVPTAVLPVLPGNDYTVSGWIRTEGLTHAGARLTARLHDAEGRPIPQSAVEGPLLRTGGAWKHVSFVVYNDEDANATDLVIELQLLQPRQFVGPDHPPDEPLLEDVTGRAWFDDITILRSPRIELSMAAPGNVATGTEEAVLNVLIRDPAADDLTARLRIFDVDGAVAHDSSWRVGGGVFRGAAAPRLAAGWFRAVLDVESGSSVVGLQSLDFTVLAQQSPPAGHRFGVILPSLPVDGADDSGRGPALAARLDVGGVLLPMAPGAAAGGAARRLVEELRRGGAEITAALEGRPLPPGATKGGGLEILGRGPEWRDEIGELLMQHGLAVSEWRLGIAGTMERLPPDDLSRLVGRAAEALAEFVAGPTILVPWPLEYEPPVLPGTHGCWITVPYQVRPEALGEYASSWAPPRTVHVELDRLPPDQFSPGDRVTDLMLRALHAWRAGAPRLSITAPWGATGLRGDVEPDPAYPAWRTLATMLEGRTFGGSLCLGEGLHCWILAGPGTGQAALAIWKAPAGPGQESSTVRELLAGGPVQVVDAFGNRHEVPLRDGAHEITATARPLFVEGVDANLASFRAALEVFPGFVEARQQVHERTLRLVNTWGVPISGTLRLDPPEGWRAAPRMRGFDIAPGGTLDLPIGLSFNGAVLTGPVLLNGTIDLSTDTDVRFGVHVPIEMGLPGLEFAAHWWIAADHATGRQDLIIAQYVTNTGDRPMSLSAFVSGPGIARQRRTIGALDPAQSAVRTFRLDDGARILAGRQVRVGLTEEGGTARINRVLEIPKLGG